MLHLRIFDPKANLAAMNEASLFVRRYRQLIVEMTRRELTDRYAGQMLGAAWAVGVPLLTMAVYVFAFAFLFRSRLSPEDNGFGYVAYVLAGLVPWLAVQDTLTRAPTSVSGSASLVKQIVFPTEVLPLKVVLATLPALLIGLAVTVAVGAVGGLADLLGIVLLLPLAVAILLVFCIGCSYVLAGTGVFLRDVKDIVAVLMSIGFFVHPIIYPPNRVPAWLDALFAFSPVSHVIWCFRDALMGGRIEHPWSWLIASTVAAVMALVGWRVFRMLRPSFGNAL